MISSKLYLKILNESNTQVQEVDKFEFRAGEDRILKCMLWHEANDAAYILEDPATVTFLFETKTGFQLELAGAIDTVNRSVISVELSATNTEKFISSDIAVEIDESEATRIVKNQTGLWGMVLLP